MDPTWWLRRTSLALLRTTGRHLDNARQASAPQASLARGIQADYTAVVNGLKLPWSTGPVEGTVTRGKFLQRQGYGRASQQLLRRRMISAT